MTEKKKPGFSLKINLNSLGKQERASKRLNEEFGTDKISPMPDAHYDKGKAEFEVKAKKKFDAGN